MTSEQPSSYEAEREELLRPLAIHPDTFGRMAVESANVQAIVDTTPGTGFELRKGFRWYTEDRLDEVRGELAALDTKERNTLNGYVTLAAPKIFRTMRKNDAHEWTDWLSGENIPLGEAASDKQLLNFLQWNVWNVTRQQEGERFNGELDLLRDMYKERVADAVASGYLSEAAEHTLENVDSTRVFVGDFFMTTMCGRGGFYNPMNGDVTIAQGIAAAGSNMEEDFLLTSLEDHFFHEETHAELEAFLVDSPLNARWIREALTEHVTRGLLKGDFETVDPSRRNDEGLTYMFERFLLSAMLEQGNTRVDTMLATRAFSGTRVEQQMFLSALDDAWQTENFLEKVTAQVEAVTAHLESDPEAEAELTEILKQDMPYIEYADAESKALLYTTMMLPGNTSFAAAEEVSA